MPLRLEARREPSRAMRLATPVLAVLLTMVTGAIVFQIMGFDGIGAIHQIFIVPVIDPSHWPDLGVKAAPLIIIAVSLAVGFRANVWNIGAEGQYVFGALATWEMEGVWILPAMCVAGLVGGMLYVAIPAFLKTRVGVNEILTSLMLTYVAIELLYYLMRGPWKDPEGYNFPQSRLFTDWQMMGMVSEDSFVHMGVPISVLIALLAWIVMGRTIVGFEVRLAGLAPAAARHGGFDAKRTVWLCLLAGGGLAGLAGTFEAAGPYGQMVPQFPVGYGFTAIIVAFLGRLHSLGIILAGLVLAVSYVGGELAQTEAGLPHAATGMFQAMMLFFLLAVDILVRYHPRICRAAAEAAT